MIEQVRHHCGLFGVYGHSDAARLAYLGLYAQQHRGQESAGIVTSDGEALYRHAGMGLVSDAFSELQLQQLPGAAAIGHVRYSTAGRSDDEHCQPLMVRHYRIGELALAHNGTLVNAGGLRRACESMGHIFQTSGDSEIILHLLAGTPRANNGNPLASVLERLEGAFSLLMLSPGQLTAIRDPWGFRPLCIGRLNGEAYVVASETCALDLVDAEYVRDVEPGEIVKISAAGLGSERYGEPADGRHRAQCIFEQIYFADPSSNIFGQNVHMVRVAMGRQLAREAPVEADLVVPVPNCARCAAHGYAKESGIELGRGFTTSHYAGRSFIMPRQVMRDLAVKMKLNVIREAVAGKRLVVVEDSVVRGTTTRGKMGALRSAGAKEIHLRVASPPIRHPCYYGIDFPNPSKLIARQRSVREIRDYLQVDSLEYLSIEGMLSSVEGKNADYCTACFSGRYPTPTPDNDREG